MLWKRVATAAVIGPLLAVAILYGKGWPFTVFVGAAVLICAIEYVQMFFKQPWDRWAAVLLTCAVYACGVALPADRSLPAMLACLLLLAFHFFRFRGDPGERVRLAAIAVCGAAYIGGFFSVYPRLILLAGGELWILMGVLAVSLGDTGAYFVGRAWGKRPLSPGISPKKTVEGAVGGLAASVATGTVFAALAMPAVPLWYAAAASAVVGVVGQGGDLFESMLKRAAGVKDSGSILPGHGGLFDRSDGFIATAPAIYLLAVMSPVAGALGRGVLG